MWDIGDHQKTPYIELYDVMCDKKDVLNAKSRADADIHYSDFCNITSVLRRETSHNYFLKTPFSIRHD